MIILPAQIEGLTSRKDKTIKVTFGTQELSPNDAAQVFQLNQKFCYIAIKEETFQSDELDNIDSIKTDLESNKTPSQRLRGILYINYQQDNEGYNGTVWSSVGGGATGGGADTVFYENTRTVTTNYTISTSNSAHSVGPISINSGVTVTIPSGARWVVL